MVGGFCEKEWWGDGVVGMRWWRSGMGVMEMEMEIPACEVALVWWPLAIEKYDSLFCSVLCISLGPNVQFVTWCFDLTCWMM